jgi:hypothetical protein
MRGGATGSETFTDRELKMGDGARLSVNMIVSPLLDTADQSSGFMVSLEDITQEKCLKSTMVRYMTNEAAEKMVETGEISFGGTPQTATVLYSDIRGGAAVLRQHGGCRREAWRYVGQTYRQRGHGGVWRAVPWRR